MKRILSIILIFAIMLTPCNVMSQEHKCSDWAEKYVERSITLDWVSPQDFTKYITRGQFCAVAEQVLDDCGLWVKFESMDTPFSDVKDDYAIKLLYCLGIVEGKSETLFCPDDLITREEAAVITMRMIDAFREWKIADITADEEEDFLYDDYKEISSWATEAVYDVRNIGILVGTGKCFEPKKLLTYEETVTMLIRLYDKVLSSEVANLEQKKRFADRLNLLMPDDKNYMFSPLSIKMALMLAANGAEGDAMDEI